MWPWEHAVFGYLVYSALSHAAYREPPDDSDALLVVFASVLPDLVDKPLAWHFGVFSTGYALAHSVLFAVPLSILVGVAAWYYDRTRLGIAFAVGYLGHLAGDVLYYLVQYGNVVVGHLFWPVVVAPGGREGFVENVVGNLRPYLEQILSLDPTPYHLLQLGTVIVTAILWVYDGAPGLRPLWSGRG